MSPSASLPSELPLDAIVGRAQEIADAIALLEAARLVCITGLGGVGKTRLARAVIDAWTHRGRRAQFLDLSAVSAAAGVTSVLASALRTEDREDRVVAGLQAAPQLLVLDNTEHLDGIGELVERWGRAAEGLHVLLTSRKSVMGDAVAEFPLRPLPLPESGEYAAVAASSAGALLLREARRGGVDPQSLADQGRALARVCKLVGGLPLGLQLAGSRLRVLSPLQVADQLGHLLAGSESPLNGVIAWSVDQLRADERLRYLALAVFPGSFEWTAAAAVWEIEDPVPQLETMLRLMLVAPAGNDRFHLLVPIREWALRQLMAEGSLDPVRERASRWASGLVHALAPELRGPRQAAAVDRLAQDHELLVAVVDWLAEIHPQAAAAMVIDLRDYWYRGRSVRDTAAHLGIVASRLDAPERRAALTGVLARLEVEIGVDRPRRLSLAQTAVDEARAAGDLSLEMEARRTLSIALDGPGDSLRAEQEVIRAVELARAIGDRAVEAALLANLGAVRGDRGDLDVAEADLREAVLIAAETDDTFSMAVAQANLSYVLGAKGQSAGALELARSAVATLAPYGPSVFLAWLEQTLVDALIEAGRVAEAATRCADSAPMVAEHGGWREHHAYLDDAGAVLSLLGGHRDAAWCWGAADGVRAGSGFEKLLLGGFTLDQIQATARRSLGAAGYEAAAAEGRRTPGREALGRVPVLLAQIDRRPEPIRGQFGRLSVREQAVLRGVACGSTDAEIARDLGISPKTVSVHVSNAKMKLGVESRIELAMAGRRLLAPD